VHHGKKWGYRYVGRPPVASERLTLTASGQVRYTLKTPSGMAPPPLFSSRWI
jgi:hypothetical protein